MKNGKNITDLANVNSPEKARSNQSINNVAPPIMIPATILSAFRRLTCLGQLCLLVRLLLTDIREMSTIFSKIINKTNKLKTVETGFSNPQIMNAPNI